MTKCPFCDPNPWEVFYEGELILGLWNSYPVTPGHAMLITRRHVDDWFAATEQEQSQLACGIEVARQAIVQRHKPDGYNVGSSIGEVSGQSVFHLHVHVVPRYRGQIPEPSDPEVKMALPPPVTRHLTTEPFLNRLLPLLERARLVDMAVGSINAAGLDLVEPVFQRITQHQGQIRMIVGQTAEPEVVQRLRQLAGSHPDQVDIRVHAHPLNVSAYRIHDFEGEETAFVGSSGLTQTSALEWNYRLAPIVDRHGQREVRAAFEALLTHPATRPIL